MINEATLRYCSIDGYRGGGRFASESKENEGVGNVVGGDHASEQVATHVVALRDAAPRARWATISVVEDPCERDRRSPRWSECHRRRDRVRTVA